MSQVAESKLIQIRVKLDEKLAQELKKNSDLFAPDADHTTLDKFIEYIRTNPAAITKFEAISLDSSSHSRPETGTFFCFNFDNRTLEQFNGLRARCHGALPEMLATWKPCLAARLQEQNDGERHTIRNFHASEQRTRAQELGEKIEKLQHLIQESKKNADASYQQAIKSKDKKDFEIARKKYLAILDVDPNNISVLYSLGICCKKLGDFKSAMDYFTRADQTSIRYERFPHPQSQYQLATCLLGAGDEKKADTLDQVTLNRAKNLLNTAIQRFSNTDQIKNLELASAELEKVEKLLEQQEKQQSSARAAAKH